MKNVSKSRFGEMGKLNNALVEIIDNSQLTPLEVIVVLELITLRLKQLLAAMGNVSREKK